MKFYTQNARMAEDTIAVEQRKRSTAGKKNKYVLRISVRLYNVYTIYSIELLSILTNLI